MATTKKAPAKKKAAPKKRVVTPRVSRAAKVDPVIEAGKGEAVMYNAQGAAAGTIVLPAELFGAKWNADLVHQVVIGMQANARPTVANTKFRGEVSGGGKKPWKRNDPRTSRGARLLGEDQPQDARSCVHVASFSQVPRR